MEFNKEYIGLISPENAEYFKVFPKDKNREGKMEFYVSQEQDKEEVSMEMNMFFDFQVELLPIEEKEIEKLIITHYRKGISKQKQRNINFSTGDLSFLEGLISEAEELSSSDIHFEPYQENCRIRYRVDGKLIERFSIPLNAYPSLLNQIKIKARLDISEKRLPQDGRIHYKMDGKDFDIRVSILPMLFGEKIVMRLLNKSLKDFSLESIGFSSEELQEYKKSISKHQGIILVSGPTGSGKTTTLYATLKELNQEDVNITTVEDPVEYTLEGIGQVNVNEQIGLTFSRALRSFLRQDPDIIMVGEIRDVETAQIAIRAALTGHLVLSTIHTNSAWGTISRLIDMGIPGFLIASTINVVVAQRLVRLLCPTCKSEDRNQAEEVIGLDSKYDLPEKRFLPVGCPDCFYTGFKGRKGIFEVIGLDAELKKNVEQTEQQISPLLKEKGITLLKDSAWQLFKTGQTSLEEILPIIIG